MAVAPLVQAGNPVLRQVAQKLSFEKIHAPELQQLIEDMRETMRKAPGVGLAAPQIGLPLAIAVIEDRAEYIAKLSAEEVAAQERSPVPFHVIINPVLYIEDATWVRHYEGCLSVSGWGALVSRARGVRVEALNEKGESVTLHAQGWYARILQHEIDHLYGTLYVDKMESRSFATVENYHRFLRPSSEAERDALLKTP